MIVSSNIPTNYHITVAELTGIEKLKLIIRGEGKYLVELIWHGREVVIEVHLKNKLLTHKKAEGVIMENLPNLFANLLLSQEWNPEDKKISLIWNEHMDQLGVLNHKENSYFYKHVDKELKEKFKRELKMMQKEKAKAEKSPQPESPRSDSLGNKSPHSGSKHMMMSLPEIEQKILKLQMALELDSKKLSAKRFSVEPGLAIDKGMKDAAKRASLVLTNVKVPT